MNVGGTASGLIRKSLGTLSMASTNAANTGEPAGNGSATLFGAVLVAADARTDRVDVASSTQDATNEAVTSGVATDPTSGGGYPRSFSGAGTSLTALPVSEALSGVTTTSLVTRFGLD